MKEFTAAEGGGSTSHLFSKGRKLKNFKFVGLMDGGMGGEGMGGEGGGRGSRLFDSIVFLLLNRFLRTQFNI